MVTWLRIKDLDHLAARLHGRRSRMAEAERLDELCRTESVADLAGKVFPEDKFGRAATFQHQLTQILIDEFARFPSFAAGTEARLLEWLLVKFQARNLKLLIRACMTKLPVEGLKEHLFVLPKESGLNIENMMGAESPEEIARLLPRGPLRENLDSALRVHAKDNRPFYLETALDRGYFHELLARTEVLPDEDREIIKPVIHQEADIFHLMLAVRGKLQYGLPPDLLMSFHAAGSRITRTRFAAMLGDPDITSMTNRIAGLAIDKPPPGRGSGDAHAPLNAAILEKLAWQRFLRLSNNAFRQSHMGLGAVVGYMGIRFVETANIITISEAVRQNVPSEAIRTRLLPYTDIEAAYV